MTLSATYNKLVDLIGLRNLALRITVHILQYIVISNIRSVYSLLPLIFHPTLLFYCFVASGPSVVSLFSFDFSSQLKFAAKYSNALREFSWNPFAAPPRLDMEMSRTSRGYTVTSIPYYCLLIFLFWFSRSTLLTQATDRADACILVWRITLPMSAIKIHPSHWRVFVFVCFFLSLFLCTNISIYYHINGRPMLNAECSMRTTYLWILPFILFF